MTGRPPVEQGGYLGAHPFTAVIGRVPELGELRQAVSCAQSSAGRLLLLVGEAGIGKTRLAQELAALPADFTVATGRCYEPYQGVAFYPFLDALAYLFVRAPADPRQALPERWPYMQRLLPDVFPQPSVTASDSRDELQRLLRSLGGFVRACAERSPVVLLIDDPQWADRASLDLLQHLVRHTRGQPVLTGGTVREPGLSSTSSLRRAMVDVQRECLLQRVRGFLRRSYRVIPGP
jgi:predicted ATPase